MSEGQPKVSTEEEKASLRLFTPESLPEDIASATLTKKYVVAPFTTLDRRQGPWQERAAQWKKLGMEGELGMKSDEGRREGSGAFNSIHSITGGNGYSGFTELHDKPISIFDPLLCELSYHWFSGEDDVIVDPFAGGSVRGIVANSMGREYVGIELNPEQVEANKEQGERIFAGSTRQPPKWIVGDSADRLPALSHLDVAMLFTCPPYGDLEVYSDNPADLSTMDAKAFADAYTQILVEGVKLLSDNRFAVIVVGNYRDRRGYLRDLVGLTVRAMREGGAYYYNEGVILDPIGTAAVRAPRQFAAARKLVRVHQSYLVFVKGDPKEATNRIRQDVELEQGPGK